MISLVKTEQTLVEDFGKLSRVAYKSWGVTLVNDQFRLVTSEDFIWEPGDFSQFKCKAENHVLPNITCTCGIYADNDMLFAARYHDIVGTVLIAGVVRFTDSGYRAQYARPDAFMGYNCSGCRSFVMGPKGKACIEPISNRVVISFICESCSANSRFTLIPIAKVLTELTKTYGVTWKLDALGEMLA